jgi:4-hydroxy-4-methyl-2-oxoglutarate aldolase
MDNRSEAQRSLPRAARAASEPGAPDEPQRTSLKVGVVDPVQATPLLAAEANSYLGQEALEPVFVRLESRQVLPALISGGIDVALLDAAAAVGEHALGWNGVAIAAFGPAGEDRSVALLVAEATFCNSRPDICERIQRAARRGLAWAARLDGKGLAKLADQIGLDPAVVAAAGLDGWWADCTPSGSALLDALAWGDVPSAVDLDQWLMWRFASVDATVDGLGPLRDLDVSTVASVVDGRGVLPGELRPAWPGARAVGFAFPIGTPGGDNLAVHRALEEAAAGDILVIATTDGVVRGLIGDLIGEIAHRRGVAGVVVDGGVRDVDGLQRLGLPVWSRAVSPTPTTKEAIGTVGKPVMIGNVPIARGDLVVAGTDGIVVVPSDQVDSVVAAARRRQEDETRLRVRIANGETLLHIWGAKPE